MSSSNYRRGADFERAVRTHLEGHGYFVTRTAGSKTKVDLIAAKQGEILFIQCKTGERFDSADWNELLALARRCGAWPILAAKIPRQAVPEYRHLCAVAVAGHRRFAGIHWNSWSPDPLGER